MNKTQNFIVKLEAFFSEHEALNLKYEELCELFVRAELMHVEEKRYHKKTQQRLADAQAEIMHLRDELAEIGF